MKQKLGFLSLFLFAFGFYLKQAAPSVTAGDSGEFMTTAATLSLAHAPSYPLYSILGHLFIDLIPFGCVPYQLNIFSSFLSAGTLVLVALVCYQWKVGFGFSVLTACLFGLSTSFWVNSLVTEVFALNTFIAGFLIWLLSLLAQAEPKKPSWPLMLLFAFVLGVGLGNHHILVFFGPAFLWIVWKKQWMPEMIQRGSLLFLFGLIGFSVYLMLPIRSSKTPPLNWGQPTNLHRFYRTLARKDYGSLSLALGEAPARNIKNSMKQMVRFTEQMSKEIHLIFVGFMMFGLFWGLRRDPAFFGALIVLFVLSGPFFYWLGNLPFTSQSSGIMGRFFILPVLTLVFGWIELFRLFKKYAAVVSLAAIFVLFSSGFHHAWAHRSGTLVLDYGRAMLRTLPPNSALFMDGGDDAFYSLAMLHYVENKRPDVNLHDRGGLIFKNVYGDDFRSIPKDKKEQRREMVERRYLLQGNLFYSTMNPSVLKGIPKIQRGFLVEAGPRKREGFSWPFVLIRSLYPLQVDDYRHRALAGFFPFMQGQQIMEQQSFDVALSFFKRAQSLGFDVDWLQTNLGFLYARKGYEAIQNNDLKQAETIYNQWARLDPNHDQPISNLGVVYERQGKLEEAKNQYQKAMKLFPDKADPVYNLAVYYWKKQDWPNVIFHLEETLRRNPNHVNAQRYLAQAMARRNQVEK